MAKLCCNKTKASFPWWIVIVGLVILKLSAFLFWLIRQRRRMLNIDPPIQLEIALPGPYSPAATRAQIARETKTASDNLMVIDGIGPKISAALNNAGIHNFATLADHTPPELKGILRTAGIRLADPASWPTQAALAAAGDFAGLKLLQDTLQAGRQGNTNR